MGRGVARARCIAAAVAARFSASDGGFQGDYRSWSAALQDAHGYATHDILERVRTAQRKVISGQAVFERDGVCFDAPDWNLGLLACLLRVAASQGGSLRVLDFGGSLGSSYSQCRPFFRELREVRWSVVEQAHFVACGRAEFESAELRFFESIEDALRAGPVDVALLSGVLPYVQAPYAVIASLASARIPWVLVDRNPVYSDVRDRLVVQHVPKRIYGSPASYPAWIFARNQIQEALAAHWEVLFEAPSLDEDMRIDHRPVQFRLILAGPRREARTP
ncbi:MAG TPA: methyltransferase, TIGR04325 family [Polyangiales bacterium]